MNRSLMNRPLSYLHSLTSEKIQEVIDDVRLMEAGVELYYAVDPHEIFDFCFPIDPTSFKSVGIDAIADDQAALYEIFFLRQQKPILLKDYVNEIQGLISYFERLGDEMYDASDMVEKLISEGALDELIDDAVKEEGQLWGIGDTGRLPAEQAENQQKLIELLQDKFNIILAVAMGIYSFGVDRFRKVCADLLGDEGHGGPYIRQLLEMDFDQRIVETIYKEIMEIFGRAATDAEEVRRRRTAFVDACAIDRLLRANSALIKAADQTTKKAPERLILYLSTAPRTAKIFDLPKVKAALPKIKGRPFSFNRDRGQIFVYVVHKSETDNHAETISRLEEVKRTLEGLESFEKSNALCSQCILDGKKPTSCDLLEICESIKRLDDHIKQRRMEVRNLGLLNTLTDYQRLLKATPKGPSQAKFMDFFRQVYESRIRRVARERMLQKQQLLFMQAVTTDMWSRARAQSRNGGEHLRAGRDAITGTIQYLPLNPVISNERFIGMLSLILDYYKTPPRGGFRKVATIDQAYKLYLDFDVQVSELDAEHELVRCLLYLAFPTKEGDERAYEHIKQMLQRESVIRQYPHAETEYLYVLCWAARRLKKYEEACDTASQALSRWGDDARFFHARAMSIYAWLADKETAAQCNYSINDAISDARKAIELFEQNKEKFQGITGATYQELIGANYNNIAYFYAWATLELLGTAHPLDEVRAFLSEARTALDKLKEWIKQEDWGLTFPEFHHTEAYVEHFEFLFSKFEEPEEFNRIQKLENAKKSVDRAIQANPKSYYVELRDKLGNGLAYYRKNKKDQ